MMALSDCQKASEVLGALPQWSEGMDLRWESACFTRAWVARLKTRRADFWSPAAWRKTEKQTAALLKNLMALTSFKWLPRSRWRISAWKPPSRIRQDSAWRVFAFFGSNLLWSSAFPVIPLVKLESFFSRCRRDEMEHDMFPTKMQRLFACGKRKTRGGNGLIGGRHSSLDETGSCPTVVVYRSQYDTLWYFYHGFTGWRFLNEKAQGKTTFKILSASQLLLY